MIVRSAAVPIRRGLPCRNSGTTRCISYTAPTCNDVDHHNHNHHQQHHPHDNHHQEGNNPSRFWKYNPQTGRNQRPIFVASTRQHVGKTTTSLAIMSGLQKKFEKCGFLKPVGQQHIEVKSNNLDRIIRVDKDVCLVREHFHLDHIDYEHMSPVIIPSGYTKKFVDGEISFDKQIDDVQNAMRHVTEASDVVLCEGTGHCAVGSIVGLNNAKVASLIGADMVLVANGGLGKYRCTCNLFGERKLTSAEHFLKQRICL